MLKKLLFGKENRSQNRRRANAIQRQAAFETLERREVFSIAIWAAERTAEQWAESVVAKWNVTQRSAPADSSLTATQEFASEQDAKSQFKEMVSQHWKDFFGASLDQSFVNRIGSFYYPMDYFPYPRDNTNFDSLYTSSYSVVSLNLDSTHISQRIDQVSTKNNQIGGVDEGDKSAFTDGYAFVLADNKIRVVDTRDPKDVKTIAVVSPHGDAQSIHVKGNRLLVVSFNYPTSTSWNTSQSIQSTVTMYDISDKEAPREISKIVMGGEIVSTRWSGDDLFVSMRRQLAFPQPRFVSSVSSDYNSTYIGADSIGRFETETEYWNRVSDQQLLDLFLPSISENGNAKHEIGDWKDWIQFTEQTPFNQTIATVFSTSSGALNLVDSEILAGLLQGFSHIDENSIYYFQGQQSVFVSPTTGNATNFSAKTGIVDVEFDRSKGELAFHGTATVPGLVRDSRMVDEYEGLLRVFSEDRTEIDSTGIDPRSSVSDRQANLTILQFDGDRGIKIGELIDIADGQSLLSAEFAGPRAVITTAVPVSQTNAVPFDPLHGIDLSNPAEPKEISELTIPGFTNYLHWIDETHLIGVGYTQRTTELNSDWVYQISLYDVSDLSSPKVLETWAGTERAFSNFLWVGSTSLAIEYNPTTRILSVPFQASAPGWFGLEHEGASAWLFRLTPAADVKIKQVGKIKQDSRVERVSVQNDYVLALSSEHLNSYHLSDVVHPIDSLRVANFAPYISLNRVTADRPIHELDEILRSLKGKIVSVQNVSGTKDQIVVSKKVRLLN